MRLLTSGQAGLTLGGARLLRGLHRLLAGGKLLGNILRQLVLERLRRQGCHAGGHRLRGALGEALQQLATRLAQLVAFRVLAGGAARTLAQGVQEPLTLEHVHSHREAVAQARGQFVAVRRDFSLQVGDVEGSLQLVVHVVVRDARALAHNLQDRVEQLVRVGQRIHRGGVEQGRGHQAFNLRLLSLRERGGKIRSQRVHGVALGEVTVRGQHVVEVVLRLDALEVGVFRGGIEAFVPLEDLLQAGQAQLDVRAAVVEHAEEQGTHVHQQLLGRENILCGYGGIVLGDLLQHRGQFGGGYRLLGVACHEFLRLGRERVQGHRRIGVLVDGLRAQVSGAGQQAQRPGDGGLNDALLQVGQAVPALHETALAQHQLANLNGGGRGVGGGDAQHDRQQLADRQV